MKTLDTLNLAHDVALQREAKARSFNHKKNRGRAMKYLETTAALIFILVVAIAVGFSDDSADSSEIRGYTSVAHAAEPTPYYLELRTSDALDRCAQVIAGYFGLSDWGNIPYAENANAKMNPASTDFYFAWPKGRIQLRTGMGDVPISAACIGTLDPLELKYVTVNGKDVL